MINLNDREWKEFIFEDIFDICRGDSLYKQYMETGTIPYISATANNNGISDYTKKPNRVGNEISLAYDGSVGSTFYQAHPWFASEKIVSIALKHYTLNRYIALFLCQAISHQKDKYSYSYKWSVGIRMNRGKIQLPVTEKDEPDYIFMEKYIKEREVNKLKKYKAYCKKCIGVLGEEVKLEALENKKWKPFFIIDVFKNKPERGKRIISLNHIEGLIPLVSSQGNNNGVTHFVGNESDVKMFYKSISVANGGSSAGKCYYHPYEFIGADHVTQCKSGDMSDELNLAIATAMTKAFMGKYSFSHEISDTRLAREKIMLPINDDGEVDYNYMEQYARNLIIKKYKDYLKYCQYKMSFSKKLNET